MAEGLPDFGTPFVEATRELARVAARYHDENPCQFDHNGFCQEPPCRNAMLRLALARFPIELWAEPT
jgi:hypothetical protein